MAVTQYVGSRYVPLFADPIEWSSANAYEPLTIVSHLGNSYTSRQYVPVGVDIDDSDYWALTGNYNAQVEQYRRETAAAKEAADAAQSDIDTLLPKEDFSSELTVKDYINASVEEVQNDINTLLPKSEFSDQLTVKAYIDTQISNALSSTPAINPNSFSGSDYEKLQAAIDYAKTNDFPTIVIDRGYDITGHSLDVTKGTSYTIDNVRHRKNLTMLFIGSGMIEKSDSGFVFTASRYSGDYIFINMHVRGNANRTGCSVFDVSKLIRIKTYGCFYEHLNYVFDGSNTLHQSGVIDNAQSVRCYGDTAFLCNSFFFNRWTYDVLLDGCIIEECNAGVTIDKSFNVSINTFHIFNCCIESTNIAVDFKVDSHDLTLVHTKIQNCYFESNGQTDINIVATYCYNLSIEDNYFAGQIANQHCVEVSCRWESFIINGNDASLKDNTCCLVYFVDDTLVTVFGVLNSVRGGILSNMPYRILTENKGNFFPLETIQFTNEVVIGYSSANGKIINFSIPLPKTVPSGMTGSFEMTGNPVIVCNGTILNPAMENFVISTNAVNVNNAAVYCSGTLQGDYSVTGNNPVALRLLGRLKLAVQ